MTIDKAKEIVTANLMFSTLTTEQKEAICTIVIEITKSKKIEAENNELIKVIERLTKNKQNSDNEKQWVYLETIKRICCPTCNVEYELDSNSPMYISQTDHCPNCNEKMNITAVSAAQIGLIEEELGCPIDVFWKVYRKLSGHGAAADADLYTLNGEAVIRIKPTNIMSGTSGNYPQDCSFTYSIWDEKNKRYCDTYSYFHFHDYNDDWFLTLQDAEKELKAQNLANSKKKQWIWKEPSHSMVCPSCNCAYEIDSYSSICISNAKFCPNCGEAMDTENYQE